MTILCSRTTAHEIMTFLVLKGACISKRMCIKNFLQHVHKYRRRFVNIGLILVLITPIGFLEWKSNEIILPQIFEKNRRCRLKEEVKYVQLLKHDGRRCTYCNRSHEWIWWPIKYCFLPNHSLTNQGR